MRTPTPIAAQLLLPTADAIIEIQRRVEMRGRKGGGKHAGQSLILWAGGLASTGLKGVSFHRPSGRYMASIKIDGRSTYLGLFDTPEQAHQAYQHSALKHFAEFARFS